jgi:hypothetical protein
LEIVVMADGAAVRKVHASAAPEAFPGIWTALCAAQATMPLIAKEKTATVRGTSKKTGEKYEMKYKYADISDVLAVVVPHLTAHGIVLCQLAGVDAGLMTLTTRLTHSPTGEHVESVYPVARIGDDQQAMGGALTYARRYALCAMIGVAPDEDTDANHVAPAREQAEERKQHDRSAEFVARARTALNNCSTLPELKAKYESIRKAPGWAKLNPADENVIMQEHGAVASAIGKAAPQSVADVLDGDEIPF